jgi:DNA primase
MQQQALHAGAEAAAPDVLESRQELRRLLNLMLIDRLKQLETEALAQAQSGEDPEALQRYKSLVERRRELIAST